MSRVAIALVVLAAAAVADAGEQDYQIRFHRPAKVGEVFNYACSAAIRQQATATVSGQERKPSEQTLLYEIEAKCKAIRVDAQGNPVQASYAIERFVKTDMDRDEEILAKGTRVIAEADLKGTKFSLLEGKLSQEQQDALEIVIQLDPEGHLDDVIYGTRERKKIGDSWPVNVREYVASMKRRDATCREEDVKATVKLTGVEEIGGIRYLKLEVDSKVADYKPSRERSKLPASLQFKSASIDAKHTMMLPVDPDVPAFRMMSASTVLQTVESEDGSFSAKGRYERAMDVAGTPVAK